MHENLDPAAMDSIEGEFSAEFDSNINISSGENLN
jgi:hypothetical protein